MDIKEIALNIAKKMRDSVYPNPYISESAAVEFAEALIAEIAKQNEHIGAIQNGKFRWSIDGGPEKWRARKEFSGKLYTIPPTAEQIANETAEAIASFVDTTATYDTSKEIAGAIRSGAWKEFK